MKPKRKHGTYTTETVCLGLDWSEIHRMDAPRQNYESIDGVTVDFPLMWKPYEFRNYFDTVETVETVNREGIDDNGVAR